MPHIKLYIYMKIHRQTQVHKHMEFMLDGTPGTQGNCRIMAMACR